MEELGWMTSLVANGGCRGSKDEEEQVSTHSLLSSPGGFLTRSKSRISSEAMSFTVSTIRGMQVVFNLRTG
jgi:hypothetical protein